ncbi:hypothetical protein Ga0080559_TMP1121 [Salipiger profundus]|uniref:Uncharacterized protein n=1 Tax=Salipiger profundus TaxID=1229727 RepID=A0A1U7D183_9RHOB|nr:hypothetical protein Ga0080559_TMP1121 [Salipiger profundus]
MTGSEPGHVCVHWSSPIRPGHSGFPAQTAQFQGRRYRRYVTAWVWNCPPRQRRVRWRLSSRI